MFIEERKEKNGKKYYLVHSYRVGKKLKKIRVYLGRNLSSTEISLKRKAAEAKINIEIKTLGGIHDPYQTVLSPIELEQLRSMEPSGKIKLHHLSENDWLKFTEAFTYATNAIEGSSVGKTEVDKILVQNEWPDRSKDEISETLGVAEAVRYLRATKEHISLSLMKELHRLVFKNSKHFAGGFRKRNEEVAVVDRQGRIIHRGAPSKRVTPLLKELVKWYKKNKMHYPPMVLAAVVHNQFESIHPFRDGNGRAGRLLLINILLKHGLPPVNIELEDRSEYYKAIQSYENEGNIRPTIELLLKGYRKLKKLLER